MMQQNPNLVFLEQHKSEQHKNEQHKMSVLFFQNKKGDKI